jgi:hypothetical protein
MVAACDGDCERCSRFRLERRGDSAAEAAAVAAQGDEPRGMGGRPRRDRWRDAG